MNQTEAREVLEDLLFCTQKARSDASEVLEGVWSRETIENVLGDLEPWIFGTKSIVVPLSDYLEKVEKGRTIYGLEFYNWMWIASKEEAVNIVRLFTREARFPEPNLQWVTDMPSRIGG